MPFRRPDVIHIGLVGGRGLCCELLEKPTFDYRQSGVTTPILAVADPDPAAPGIRLAEEMGLLTFRDHHQLYDPRYNINLIVILTPDDHLLSDILESRPPRIRILSSHVFEIFWRAIGREEQKLREQNEAMQAILNGINDFILVITPELEIIEANHAFLSKMGLARREVIGRHCHDVFERLDQRCDMPGFACPLQAVVQGKQPFRQVRSRTGRDGQPRHYEICIYPVWEKDGKISRFIHISRDITQRVEQEVEITRRLEAMVAERTRQLRETHAKLLHQDKMASLGKLSASVVHEINNPVAGILNLVLLIQRILAEGPLSEEDLRQFRSYLSLMETETRRISRIVSDLLSFARPSGMEPKPVDLRELVERTLVLNANLLKLNSVKVDNRVMHDLPPVFGSEDRLQQVLMNLISNAAEAMENGGGLLVIDADHMPRRKKVRIRFRDTGIGIPSGNRSRVFEPFFTTKVKGRGVGLGLAVAYGIVEEHGGLIEVNPAEGQGTVFSVELPVSGKAHRPPKEKPDGRHQDPDR